ncbi:phosphopentomutase [Microbispora sp. H11081]|uniref:phosphopentomutase n=1 Tax=Microbispora sp. H11081 TaxID=2729107 RepID=UPI001475CAB2|nr:phosphopentomutase [Microbispora sp. H11081]
MNESMGDRRVVILVLDGLGVGVMPDHPPEDAGANTLRHVDQAEGPLKLPNLAALGFGNLTDVDGVPPEPSPSAAYGRCALRHPGADTYMGHQELMGGGLDNVRLLLLADVLDEVVAALTQAGHRCEPLTPGLSPLVVDGCVLVADNIEARPRLNINVTASQDDISFDDLTRIGEIVRATVPVPRVIVVGGRGFDIDAIRAHVKERASGQIGVDTPALGVYDEHYQVRHLGVDFAVDQQLPSRARQAGYDVVLLGKAADVVRCEGAVAENIVRTEDVLARVVGHLDAMAGGLIVANVQETDLAGHEQDVERYARTLRTVDELLPDLLDRLRPGDALFITGDHGNDPAVGHSQHTREYTPAIAYGPGVSPVPLGVRATLADIGATAGEILGVPALRSGTSFLKEIWCS